MTKKMQQNLKLNDFKRYETSGVIVEALLYDGDR